MDITNFESLFSQAGEIYLYCKAREVIMGV